MKRTLSIALLFSLVAAFGAASCAKGSDDERHELDDAAAAEPIEEESDASDDDADGSSDAGSEEGGPHDSGGDELVDAESDAADEADADEEDVEGGPDPGRIVCGTDVCDATQGAKCCVQNNFHACYPPVPPQKCFGHYVWCDEAADCAYYSEAWVCFVNKSPYGFTFGCNSKGAAWDPQVCKSDKECLNGEPCVEQTCGDIVIRSCGPLPDDFCNESI